VNDGQLILYVTEVVRTLSSQPAQSVAQPAQPAQAFVVESVQAAPVSAAPACPFACDKGCCVSVFSALASEWLTSCPCCLGPYLAVGRAIMRLACAQDDEDAIRNIPSPASPENPPTSNPVDAATMPHHGYHDDGCTRYRYTRPLEVEFHYSAPRVVQ